MVPDGLLHLRLAEFSLLYRPYAELRVLRLVLLILHTRINLDVGVVRGRIVVLIHWVRGPTVDCVFPTLIELAIFTTDVIVRHRRIVHCLEDPSLVVVIGTFAARARNSSSVREVLSVSVLLLPQVKHFKFLPDRRGVP